MICGRWWTKKNVGEQKNVGAGVNGGRDGGGGGGGSRAGGCARGDGMCCCHVFHLSAVEESEMPPGTSLLCPTPQIMGQNHHAPVQIIIVAVSGAAGRHPGRARPRLLPHAYSRAQSALAGSAASHTDVVRPACGCFARPALEIGRGSASHGVRSYTRRLPAVATHIALTPALSPPAPRAYASRELRHSHIPSASAMPSQSPPAEGNSAARRGRDIYAGAAM